MILTEVSKMAITTLRSHALESKKQHPIIHDPMAEYCLEKITENLTINELHLIFDKHVPSTLSNYIALRAHKYDEISNVFIKEHPSGTIINLGCGFDTRYWRLNKGQYTYFDLDLPEVIQHKKTILKEHLDYEMIGCSVLDLAWINQILSYTNNDVLFLAEGLFMYLPRKEVIGLFSKLSESFEHSQMTFETVHHRYTYGLSKWMIETKIKQATGSTAGSFYQYGIKNAQEIESYAPGIQVVDQWSYLEDPNIKPKILRIFRHLKTFTRTQWTVTATLN